jgi:hypothetical protein
VICEKTTTRASSVKKTPVKPARKMTGAKTEMVVSVPDTTAGVTSRVPSTAASAGGRPSCRCR